MTAPARTSPGVRPRDIGVIERLLGRLGYWGLGVMSDAGRRAYFGRDIIRGLAEPRTWAAEAVRQMRSIGVGSLPLVIIVAAFLGGVTAVQTRYQLVGGVQLSVVGLIARQSIVLELGPLGP